MLTRRDLFSHVGAGFAGLALIDLLGRDGFFGAAAPPASRTHHKARAKYVVFLFMNGAPSHVDTFDPKPALAKHEGEQPEGMKSKGSGFMPSPFTFAPRG